MMAGVLGLALPACSKHAPPPPSPDAGIAVAAVPVRVAVVSVETVRVLVSGTGHTDAIEQQKVNAPFRGTIRHLLVVDGDHVSTGQIVGSIMSQNSEAAIAGANAMLRGARTPSDKQDAERALTIAREGAVAAPLRVPESGVVVSHGASEGELVKDQQAILSIAATDSIVFVASIAQADLPKIHPRETVMIDVASTTAPLPGLVHGILPTVSLTDLRAPVRIDFTPAQAGLQIGVFGTARVVIAEKPDAVVVPTSAILRDDVHATTRIALVDAEDHAHFREVNTGIVEGDKTQIVSPALSPGDRVIVQGQVGLVEGTRVVGSP